MTTYILTEKDSTGRQRTTSDDHYVLIEEYRVPGENEVWLFHAIHSSWISMDKCMHEGIWKNNRLRMVYRDRRLSLYRRFAETGGLGLVASIDEIEMDDAS